MIKQILYAGVTDEDWENLSVRVKLNNIIAISMIVVSLSCIPFFFFLKTYFPLVVCLLAITSSLIGFYLQTEEKHEAGFSVIVLTAIALLTTVTLYLGIDSNIHLFLICIAVVSLVLFENNRSRQLLMTSAAVISFFLILFYLRGNQLPLQISPSLSFGLEILGYFNFFVLISFALIFFSIFLNQRGLFQKELLTQNLILEQKNSQITDSIKYAKHIQNAILPRKDILNRHFKESFVFYKPKDIVAGDFYWLEQIDGLILFAAADSTGHGVPGAMVSIVCTNVLNQAVKEHGLRDPGQILDQVRELIVRCFRTSDMGVKDGMDISLCAVDLASGTLKWAGANNPLWIIRSKSDKIDVVKPDKQSVALTEKPHPFTTHTVQLHKDDCFYMFTDGYADQFGGENAKKFMQKRLKELLLRIYKKPMELQKHLIHDNLLTWMGNSEQIDDICFLGVRL